MDDDAMASTVCFCNSWICVKIILAWFVAATLRQGLQSHSGQDDEPCLQVPSCRRGRCATLQCFFVEDYSNLSFLERAEHKVLLQATKSIIHSSFFAIRCDMTECLALLWFAESEGCRSQGLPNPLNMYCIAKSLVTLFDLFADCCLPKQKLRKQASMVADVARLQYRDAWAHDSLSRSTLNGVMSMLNAYGHWTHNCAQETRCRLGKRLW
jgi:hypothetical protein